MMGGAWRGGAFDGQAASCGHPPVAVEGSTERIDNAPQEFIACCHVHDPARAPDFTSRMEMPVFSEQNNANVIGIHVERNAGNIAGKHHQFIKAHAGETRNPGDAGGDT
jgi:hypothetical protein